MTNSFECTRQTLFFLLIRGVILLIHENNVVWVVHSFILGMQRF